MSDDNAPVFAASRSGASAFRVVNRFAALAAVGWVVGVGMALGFNISIQRTHTVEMARSAALDNFNKDQAYRLWGARHGGVYVPEDERTPRNPALAHVDGYVTLTEDGRRLTLMNPAYMLRQMMEEFDDLYGIGGRIVSLKPLRPGNAPDPWERQALLSFERGASEAFEIVGEGDDRVLRLMRPMATEESCLKCHAHQGYRVGDVRGGVGVSVPMAPYLAHQRQAILTLAGTYGVFGMLGLAGIAGGWTYARRRIDESDRLMAEVERSEERYRRMFQGIKAVALLVDPESGAVVDANPAAANYYGYSVERLRAMRISEVNVLAPSEIAAEMERAMKERRTVFQFVHRQASGALRDVEVQSGPVDIEGRTLLFSIVQDVTERVRAEGALRLSEERFRKAFEASPGLQVISRLRDGLVLDVNHAWTDILGYSRIDTVGRSTRQLGVWDDPEQRARMIAQLDRDGSVRGMEVRLKAKDGRVRDVLVSCDRIDLGGDGEGILLVGLDISERKVSEQALRTSEEQFRGAFSSASHGMALVGVDGRLIEVNRAFKTLFGHDDATLIGRPFTDLSHPEDQGKDRTETERLLKGEIASFNVERRCLHKTGRLIWIDQSVALVRDADGAPRHVVLQIQDVTAQHLIGAALKESENKYRAVFASANDALLIFSPDGVVRDANPAACRLFGYGHAELIGLSGRKLVDPEHFIAFSSYLEGRSIGEKDQANTLTWQVVRKDGSTFEAEIRGATTTFQGAEHRLAVIRDVTERRRIEEQIRHIATHDRLTDLPDRTLFMDRLGQALARAHRAANRVGVLFVDLDRFKPVNDELGHEVGDAVLCEVARRLRSCVRATDTVSRYGGDEFMVVVTDVNQDEDALRVARSIVDAVNRPFDVLGHRVSVGASVGLALFPDHGQVPEDLIKAADQAMYLVKQSGRNAIRVAEAAAAAKVVPLRNKDRPD